MKQDPQFIHLRLHTEHSLLEGAVRVRNLAKICADAEMPAVAVTDTNNMFAALEFSELAAEGGLQPIIGCQLDLEFAVTGTDVRVRTPAPVVLLAQNESGYRNLMKLNSCFYLRGDGATPRVTVDELCGHSDGLILLTGGPDGPLGKLVRDGGSGRGLELLQRLSDAFPARTYVELQRHPEEGTGLPEAERQTERWFVETAYALGLPIVATNDVYFPDQDMYEAHDALICIAEGTYVDQREPRRRLTPQHRFKNPREMATLFADLPEALENTVEIAQRCAFRATKRQPILPGFADNEVEELRRQAREGLNERLAAIDPSASREEYERRLKFELDLIEKMGFTGYFLIVADFIKWAKGQNIPVGPGRGSGAGSLAAYALTITDLDPLRYGLLFERFLNPERVSMPDFDIDFCMNRREEVIEYVQSRYGRDRVAQIITFGALLSKAAVRDVGRVLQMPYGQVDRLAKMIPVEGVKPVSIEQALKDEPRLRKAAEEEIVSRLLNYGNQLEGLLRNASTHAAGVVIGDRPLDELVPLYQDFRSEMPASQFSMKWVEAAGLVKFDFLGLKTLTMIQNAVDLLKRRGIEIDQGNIPLDDEKTFDLYTRARTVAVFQVESAGMMDALRRMKPTCIEDIVALVALYRPGPMENIPKYCEVKNGLSKREFLHPTIDHILDETQGIIVYQEQVMQIAREMAGYSLGGADLLRRAMGKKIKEEMDAERPKFLEGARKNGVDAGTAVKVWNLLEKFANYGFNKSHAVAYAVVSYQTAWLKANHPVEFMAGVMNCDLHLTDKLSVYAEEVRRELGIEIVPPCVNRSDTTFSVHEGKVVYALGALKNVGVEAMRLITGARGDRPFVTLFDLARRADLKRIGKRPMEMLARAGAFDRLDPNRKRVLESLDALTAYSIASHDQRNSSQASLFGETGDDLPEPRLAPVEDWLPQERLAEEHTAIGFYLTGHPLDDYVAPLRRQGVTSLADVAVRAERAPLVAKVGGTVLRKQERKSAKGDRFAYVQISDPTGLHEAIVFSDVFAAAGERLEPGNNVVMTLTANMEGNQLRLRVRSVDPVSEVIADAGPPGLRIFVENVEAVTSTASLLERADGKAGSRTYGEVQLCLRSPDLPGELEIALGDRFQVNPRIKGALKAINGVLQVEDT
ncbi:MAG: DNA polymerase III subunit alpha [Rhodobacter sp.]|nr:DNA polymerase III subunit alpha [Rhodobacter sp.]MCY4169164.1 DNA polymerase III subunit alpha [Rhodobacter sp.]MCY4241906.1 DNA polymerase III subunit alpha [Rhodobacter sp.]